MSQQVIVRDPTGPPKPPLRWWWALPAIGLVGAAVFGLTTGSPESAPTTLRATGTLPTADTVPTTQVQTVWRPVPLPGLGELRSGFVVEGGLIALGVADTGSFLWRLEPAGTWSYLASIPDAEMVAGIEWGGKWLTVGMSAGAPTAWTSDPGREWTAVALPVEDGSRGGQVNGMVAGDGGLVAFGATGSAPDDLRATVWLSNDGMTWRTDAVQSSPPSVVSEVLWGPDGMVAAGHADGRAAIWTSPDGAEWRLHDLVGAEHASEFFEVASLPAGGFLALGSLSGSLADHPDGSAWRSTDLTNWENLLDLPFGFLSLEPIADQVWGMGWGPYPWTTRDGETWLPTNLNGAEAATMVRAAWAYDIVMMEQGLVVLGAEEGQPMAWIHGSAFKPVISVGGPPLWRPRTVLGDSAGGLYVSSERGSRGLLAWAGGKIWLSDDGIAWNPVEDLSSHATTNIGGFGEWSEGRVAWGLIAGAPALWASQEGWDWENIDLGREPRVDQVIWSGSWQGSLRAAAVNWGTDGVDWYELARTAGGDWQLSLVGSGPLVWGIRPFGEGFVASRFETDAPPLVVVSSDGLTWEAVHEGYLVGSVGSGLVANPVDGNHAWFSADGRSWSETPVPPAATAVPLADGRGAVQTLSGGEYTVWLTDDGATWEAVPAGVASGYYPFDMVLIPGTGELLALGTNHGVLAVWEYTG